MNRATDVIASNDFDPTKAHEECGVFGVYGCSSEINAATLAYIGLYALQHRGQESAGMVVSDGSRMEIHKGMGLVPRVFDDTVMQSLSGHRAIGHVRYSTTGGSHVANAQPILVRSCHGHVSLAHNGNLVNADEIRNELEITGATFHTTTDTEVIVNLISHYGGYNLEEALLKGLVRLKGSYAIVMLTKDTLIGVRDPLGLRPLCIGTMNGTYLLSSEECALSSIGATFLRDVEPGEMIIIDEDGLRSVRFAPRGRKAHCCFEYIYFARPDSTIDGISVYLARKAMGKQLWIESPIEADVVLGNPDSGTSAAMGFAEASGIPFEIGIIKNRYIGRTFIQPSQEMRELGVRIKINVIKQVVAGKRVVLIDDSIVRGTTSDKTVRLLREAGAREVHMYVSSPPYRHPCYYGIDTSEKGELIAATRSIEQIRDVIGCDTLHYLTVEGLQKAIGHSMGDLCLSCLNGEYCTELPKGEGGRKFALEG